jgi:hypothetical protein
VLGDGFGGVAEDDRFDKVFDPWADQVLDLLRVRPIIGSRLKAM